MTDFISNIKDWQPERWSVVSSQLMINTAKNELGIYIYKCNLAQKKMKLQADQVKHIDGFWLICYFMY